MKKPVKQGGGKKTVFLVRLVHRAIPEEGEADWICEHSIWRLLGKDLARHGIFVESVEEQK